MSEPGRVPSTGARCWLLGPANVLAAGVARLPQRALLAAGTLLHALAAPVLAGRRRIAARNIALCFPALDAAAQSRLLQSTMRDNVTGLLESLRGWFGRDADLHDLVAIEGLEHLRAARAGGRGALLVTGHMPHLELGGRMLGLALREPLAIVARRNNRGCLQRFLEGARARAFHQVIDKKDARGLLRTLSRGGVVAWAGDQDFNYQSAFVPFFGVPAATISVMSQLGRRADAAVLPYGFQREADGRYRLWIEPAWEPLPPAQDAARYMAWLERVVRRHPSQYLWVHRRFKTRPPGGPDLYSGQ
ncbi:lysophospholipid acyltransferase family protein [Agrilutibacter solisilvae]|uniref:Lipid A biosynthesis lauroyl acyltransferase n=1 Tax=Agrilutibacter solisilvae TaxID=2763317 RepID=A0A974Y137_9GAMM|nr:lipid A biosynthesis lauroyl acyltransferase [Lysobacter solisilvae]QSX79487.1 lipid A biosynthesis lauroyl acyltransferase [Lysobacter solisilvae]